MALLLRENTTQDWRVGLVGGPDTLLPAPTAAAELARWVAWGCCECDGSQMRSGSLVLHLSPRSPLWPHLGPASAGRLGGDGADRPKANVSVLLKPVARAGRLSSRFASAAVLVRLLPIISHAVKRFLGTLRPITCGILLDLTTRRCVSRARSRSVVPLLSLLSHSLFSIHPQAKGCPGSLEESAQVRMASHRLVGRRACRHIHARSSSSSSSPAGPALASQGTA